jgi:hypothetical protein
MHRSIVSFATVVLSAGWLIAQPAVAQNQPATPGVPDAAAPDASVSDQKLDQTAAAIQNVKKVKDNYGQKLSAASPDEKDKIMSDARVALEKAVTDQGLSVEEYDSIIAVAQNHPNVRERLVQRLGGAAK